MDAKPDPVVAAFAATHFAERLTAYLRERDPEGLKRLLDRAAEDLEAKLADPPPSGPHAGFFRHAAAAELSLIRRVFES